MKSIINLFDRIKHKLNRWQQQQQWPVQYSQFIEHNGHSMWSVRFNYSKNWANCHPDGNKHAHQTVQSITLSEYTQFHFLQQILKPSVNLLLRNVPQTNTINPQRNIRKWMYILSVCLHRNRWLSPTLTTIITNFSHEENKIKTKNDLVLFDFRRNEKRTHYT